MKLLGIGDLFIPSGYIQQGFSQLDMFGVQVQTMDWELADFEELQHVNHKIEQGGSEAVRPPQAVFDAAEDAQILITQFCPVTKELIDHCTKLKMIGVLRAGLENINLTYATEKGILVFNTPGRNADSVADFTVGVLLCECRNIARGYAALKNGDWVRTYSNSGHIPDLPGKTVGIVGLGEIGLKVAQRLKGFDVTLLAYDPYVIKPPYGVKMVPLDELMERSDFVTVHVRASKQTENLIDRSLIAKMKKTAYLINTARASVVDENALYDALYAKKIAGAAIDVFDVEPLGTEHPMVQLDNVTVTPHMAGGSNDAFFHSPQKLADEMKRLFLGGVSNTLVNARELSEVAVAFSKRFSG